MVTEDIWYHSVPIDYRIMVTEPEIGIGYSSRFLHSIFENWDYNTLFHSLRSRVLEAIPEGFYTWYRSSYELADGSPFYYDSALFEKEPRNDFFRDILSKISSRFSETDSLEFVKSESVIISPKNFYHKYEISSENGKSYLQKLFGKVEKFIKCDQLKITSRELFQNLIETKNRLDTLNSQELHQRTVRTAKLYSAWFDKILDWVSVSLFKIVKQRLSVQVFIWTIISIIWLSNFLDKCNLDVRAI